MTICPTAILTLSGLLLHSKKLKNLLCFTFALLNLPASLLHFRSGSEEGRERGEGSSAKEEVAAAQRRLLTDRGREGGREREREEGRQGGRAQILEAMSSSRKRCHLRQTGIRSIADTTKTNNDK